MPNDTTRPTFTVDDDTTRGRRAKPTPPAKPKTPPRSTGARAEADDVRRAMKTLESAYSAIGAGLLLYGTPKAADEWSKKADDLNASNAAALEASPRLAKLIASSGASGGAVTLLTTHVIAFGSIYAIAKAEKLEQAENVSEGREPTEPRPTFADRMRRARGDAAPEPEPAPVQQLPRRNAPRADDPTWVAGL